MRSGFCRLVWCYRLFAVYGALFFGVSQALAIDKESLANSAQSLHALIEEALPLQRPESLAVMVFDTTTGEEVFSFNSEKKLKPASVLKVLSSLVALELLGPQYHFATRVFAERPQSGLARTLYVQGAGDPGLTVETAWAMARAIRRRGIGEVSNMVVDASLFEGNRQPVGQRAYQTGSSALAFNYNSFSFEVCPTTPGQRASVVADPIEVGIPLTGAIITNKSRMGDFAIEQLDPKPRQDGSLTYRLSGAIGARQDCATVYRSMPEPERVFGATFLGMLKAVGVKVPPAAQVGRTPEQLDMIYAQESPPLSQIIRDLNNYSNNFIAEQLLFAIGQTERGTFSRERGLQRMAAFLKSMGFGEEEFALSDASGLSHDNRLSARIIMALLRRALQNQAIAPEFESSLAVGERSGTLRKRPVDPQGVVLRGKTGTLDGVSSLAGYVVGKSGRKYAFVVLQNAIASVERAHQLENKIVAILSRS